jgi:uncharacterized protein YyaL (SSP411 family)
VSESNAGTNRLAGEKSPYLLQHAENPVDWYPWGEEAFQRARQEDKPVFLSIGYSTCHWCHVMEEESFSDPDTAAIMNRHFVCIKVDREERPDIDNVYMAAVVAMTGRGGWPLTVFLTPDQKPFFGGTYFPPEDRWGMSGLRTVLLSVAGAWEKRRDEVVRSGDALAETLASGSSTGRAAVRLDRDVLTAAFAHFRTAFDKERGGFGGAPKFPMGHNLSFLMRYAARNEESGAQSMVEKTLDAMAAGGIYDQIGGGFHRYSTDGHWRIPHFEKMLYDQALLPAVYLEAFQMTGKRRYARTAAETLDYVLRDMTAPEGGFYSAEDADSPLPGDPKRKKEGAFYMWTPEEIARTVGEEAAGVAMHHFGIRPEGNAISDPHGELRGRNVLYRAHTLEETAEKAGIGPDEAAALIKDITGRLFAARSHRPRPHLDDKILTDWNGLMISSLAAASRILGEPRYCEAAERAAGFIMRNLAGDGGHLLHRHRDGESAIPGSIDDYAFLMNGMIDLYEATFDHKYLSEAARLAALLDELFWDKRGGGFFFTACDAESLIVRKKEIYDGAIPSGNSVAALGLLRLGGLTARPQLESRAHRLMEAFSAEIRAMPAAHCFMLTALDFALGPRREIVIAEGQNASTVREMAEAVFAPFMPNKVVVMLPAAAETSSRLAALAPYIADYHAVDGKTAAYVCVDRTCRRPVMSVEALKAALRD